ncbi:hypothetical protein M9H77_28176 [Catharanthus roseus]|uniref:Uncharacterized protein n=1 Tax=Catharanthus roseus TaxID=4058 RepID=A0ACC0AEM3_CATRO|nr:hypothetical protein M9H77_28176 [Catharanthus roseus]
MTIFHGSKPFRICFSFAAYAKNLIEYLKFSNIPIEEGLTDVEFSSIESNLNFSFPPDLRSILQEGLPIGPGFPNWRLSSFQQLEILTNLPILGLSKEVSRNNFWLDSWGEKPIQNDESVAKAKRFFKTAPLLIPLFRNFYIPSAPCLAGNPVFYVNGGEIKILSFDIAGFFQQVEFRRNDDVSKRPSLSNLLNAPPWAATEPRRIDFWTELVERGEKLAAREGTRWWWSGDLRGCLEEVFGILKTGGWKEDDVREMMMMDGYDEVDQEDRDFDDDDKKNMILGREFVTWHIRLLSRRLLRAGWSSEDVMDSLGFTVDYQFDHPSDADSCFDFQHLSTCDDRKPPSCTEQMNPHSIIV